MKQKALCSIGAFARLSEKSLQSLEAITKLRYIEKNAILYYEGEHVRDVYLLARGKVEIYKIDRNGNELFLYYIDGSLDRGLNASLKTPRLINTFGSFATYEAYSSVRGVCPSEIVSFDIESLGRLVGSNIEIAHAFLTECMQTNVILNEFINLKEVYDSTSRVAYFLQTKLDYFNYSQRQLIARELNIKLETLSRILQKMQMQGLIAKDRHGDIYIKDSAALSALCGNV